MNTLFLAIFQPVETFRKAKTTDFSVMSMIVLLFLMLVNLILMIPITEKVTALTFSTSSLSEDQIETITQIVYEMRYLQIVGIEISYILMLLFYGLLLYLFVSLAKGKLKYKKALQLIIYSYLIIIIGDLVNTAILYIRGLDAITNAYENSFLGLNILTSVEQVGVTVYVFLSYITPFQLAFVILLSIGVKVFTKINSLKSLTISVLIWIISIILPTLSVYFSQSTL